MWHWLGGYSGYLGQKHVVSTVASQQQGCWFRFQPGVFLVVLTVPVWHIHIRIIGYLSVYVCACLSPAITCNFSRMYLGFTLR